MPVRVCAVFRLDCTSLHTLHALSQIQRADLPVRPPRGREGGARPPAHLHPCPLGRNVPAWNMYVIQAPTPRKNNHSSESSEREKERERKTGSLDYYDISLVGHKTLFWNVVIVHYPDIPHLCFPTTVIKKLFKKTLRHEGQSQFFPNQLCVKLLFSCTS